MPDAREGKAAGMTGRGMPSQTLRRGGRARPGTVGGLEDAVAEPTHAGAEASRRARSAEAPATSAARRGVATRATPRRSAARTHGVMEHAPDRAPRRAALALWVALALLVLARAALTFVPNMSAGVSTCSASSRRGGRGCRGRSPRSRSCRRSPAAWSRRSAAPARPSPAARGWPGARGGRLRGAARARPAGPGALRGRLPTAPGRHRRGRPRGPDLPAGDAARRASSTWTCRRGSWARAGST